MSTIRIEVPQLSEFYTNHSDKRVALLHAPVACRADDTVLVDAMQKAISRPMTPCVVHVVDEQLAHYKLRTTLSYANAKKIPVRQGVTSYRLDNGSVVYVSTGQPAPDAVHYVYGIDTHLQKRDLTEVYSTALRWKLAGTLADRGHWFYQFSEQATCTRFTWPEILERWPQLAGQGLRQDNPYYRRHMVLEDVIPKFAVRFSGFAKDRLYIRTDKPIKKLTPRQQQAAEGQHGTPIVPFEVSALQKRYLAEKRLAVARGRKPWFILLKYRRGGFTTLEQAQSYMSVVSQPNSQCVTFAHNLESTRRIFRMVGIMHENDPHAPKLVAESKQQLELPNGSLFFIGTAGGAGFRGDTLQRVHGSEVAKWCEGPNQVANVDELASGFLGAASHGEVVLESTPNGKEWFYQAYMDAKMGLSEFTPIFLPWFADPINRHLPHQFNEEELRETITSEEEALIQKHKLTWAQLSWRREQKRVYKRKFLQEMPEDDVSCFLTSGTCFFDVDLLMDMLESIPPDKEHGRWAHLAGGYEVRWKEPEHGAQYVVGCDTSEGIEGGDLNGVGVLNKRTGEQVAAVHGLFSPTELAQHAVRLAAEYNRALLGIERENHGHAVIQRVLDLGYNKPHFRGGELFFFCPLADHRGQGQTLKNSRPGWTTNNITRPVMLDDLADAIEDGSMKINDRDFIDECLSFRKQQNGKFEADGVAHDDTVFKWAIAWQMLTTRRPKPRITIVGDTKPRKPDSNGNGNGRAKVRIGGKVRTL